MSKLNIGVGDEFPLDESPAGEDRHARRHRHHHHGHHGRHRHSRHGFPYLSLLIAVALVAALIGAAKIPLLAAHAILVMAGLFVLLAVLAHWHLHRRHRHGEGV